MVGINRSARMLALVAVRLNSFVADVVMTTPAAPLTSAVRRQLPIFVAYSTPSRIQIVPPEAHNSSRLATGFLLFRPSTSKPGSADIRHKSVLEPSSIGIFFSSQIDLI